MRVASNDGRATRSIYRQRLDDTPAENKPGAARAYSRRPAWARGHTRRSTVPSSPATGWWVVRDVPTNVERSRCAAEPGNFPKSRSSPPRSCSSQPPWQSQWRAHAPTSASSGPRTGWDGYRQVLRTLVDGARDNIVKTELEGATHCLSDDQSGLWTYHYTAGNSLDEPDVATLTADPARAPDQRALAAAALAAHNQLAPWVEAIKVTVGNQVVLMIDRRWSA